MQCGGRNHPDVHAAGPMASCEKGQADLLEDLQYDLCGQPGRTGALPAATQGR